MREEVSLLIDEAHLDAESGRRLEDVYNQWSNEFLETPRDVVRVANSLKLNFVPVRENVDPGDMVFLQIIRTKKPQLFDWIEKYVADLSAIGDWGFIPPGDHEKFGTELLNILEKDGEERIRLVYALSEHLPGFDLLSLHKEDATFKVFSLDGANNLMSFASKRRLASPAHYSFYFSFSAPSGSLDDTEVEKFLIACEDAPEKAAVRFRQLVDAQRPQGGRLAEVLIDRVTSPGMKISAVQIKGLFQVLGEEIDGLVAFSKTNSGYSSFLEGSRQEIFGLIDRIESKTERVHILRNLFTRARSLAWLTGILHASIPEHAPRGEKHSREENPLLSSEEFELCKEIYSRRLQDAPPENLLQVPYFLRLIFTWHRLGVSEGAVGWVRKQAESDQGFLDVLDKMKSWSQSSSDGIQYKLRPTTLETFFDGVAGVKKRLEGIVHNGSGQE